MQKKMNKFTSFILDRILRRSNIVRSSCSGVKAFLNLDNQIREVVACSTRSYA